MLFCYGSPSGQRQSAQGDQVRRAFLAEGTVKRRPQGRLEPGDEEKVGAPGEVRGYEWAGPAGMRA